MFLKKCRRLGVFAFKSKIFLLLFAVSLTVYYFALATFDRKTRLLKTNEEYGSDVFSKGENLLIIKLFSEVKILRKQVAQLTESLKLQNKSKTLPLASIDNKNSCCYYPVAARSKHALDNTESIAGENRTSQRGLNVHIWYENCLKTIEDLCNFPIFPGAPDKREIVPSFDITRSSHDFSQRLFGFLHPPESGRYIFALASDDSSELWLSRDEDWKNSKLIASVGDKDKTTSVVKDDFLRFPNQRSSPIFLEKGKRYFIEALHIEAGGQNFLQVAWKGPGMASLESLKLQYLSTYFVGDNLNIPKYFDLKIPKLVSCRNIEPISKRNPYFVVVKQKPVYLEHEEVEKVLPTCKSYNPSYIVRGRKLKRFEAFREIMKYTSDYPLPEYKHVVYPRWASTKPGLTRSEADKVVGMYMDRLEKEQPGKYKLEEIKTVEEKLDKKYKNKRFFIELELMDLHQNKAVVLSEYVQQPNNSKSLCYPKGLQWNKTADVYFVVTAKNQGRWVQHFINNLEKIYEETKDEHVRGLVFDYNSDDFDLEWATKRTSLPKVTIVQRDSKKSFVKTTAYNDAVATIKNPNSIVFLMDLHLQLASSVVDEIRKRTIQGKQSYTPILTRLKCGANAGLPRGSWEAMGFGLVGLYKSDWDKFGGFNIHQGGWGGEDWDLIDRITETSLELERLRTPHVLHFHQSKEEM